MAKNRVYSQGQNLSAEVPEGTKSGGPVVIGQIPGVALIDRRTDGTAEVATRGVYELEVEGKNKAGEKEIKVGDIIYLTAGVLNVNNEEGVRFGYALQKVTKNTKAKIQVKLGYGG